MVTVIQESLLSLRSISHFLSRRAMTSSPKKKVIRQPDQAGQLKLFQCILLMCNDSDLTLTTGLQNFAEAVVYAWLLLKGATNLNTLHPFDVPSDEINYLKSRCLANALRYSLTITPLLLLSARKLSSKNVHSSNLLRVRFATIILCT